LLGLDDGHLVRVQGGARLGLETDLGTARLTTTVTGLLYEDVDIHGGAIQGAAFGTSNILAKADEGKLRARGILAFNIDFGGGVSSFVQGEVRGGNGLTGGGGMAGLRIQW